MAQLIQRLAEGPIDIIGDVHGEADALRALLDRLGCDPDERTATRPIVFVGDLVDRGPDSPAVVEIVMGLVEAGLAQCVLGNHELNILLGSKKEGNGWIWGDETDDYQMILDEQVVSLPFDSKLASPAQAERFQAFFAGLPLILERDDLRVVHACWHAPSIARLPDEGDAAQLGRAWSREIQEDLDSRGVWAEESVERKEFAQLQRLDVRPTRDLPAHGVAVEARQNQHPLKVLTSGQEERIPFERIFFVGGKWRFCRRFSWWDQYDEDTAVVVGHYWRQRIDSPSGNKPDRWATRRYTDWAGPKGNVFCVDYSVGRRFLARSRGQTEDFNVGLAALRWPERELVFDDRDAPTPTTVSDE